MMICQQITSLHDFRNERSYLIKSRNKHDKLDLLPPLDSRAHQARKFSHACLLYKLCLRTQQRGTKLSVSDLRLTQSDPNKDRPAELSVPRTPQLDQFVSRCSKHREAPANTVAVLVKAQVATLSRPSEG